MCSVVGATPSATDQVVSWEISLVFTSVLVFLIAGLHFKVTMPDIHFISHYSHVQVETYIILSEYNSG